MIAALVDQAVKVVDPDALSQGIQALTDAVSQHNIALAIVASVLAVGTIALKVMGKNVPFLDAGVGFVLDLTRKLSGKKVDTTPGVAAVVPVVKDGEVKGDGVANVVSIKKDE